MPESTMYSTKRCFSLVKLAATIMVIIFVSGIFFHGLSISQHRHYAKYFIDEQVSFWNVSPLLSKHDSNKKKVTFRPATSFEMEKTLNLVRIFAQRELKFQPGHRNILMNNTHGAQNRLKILLVSSWRSGSTFLGQVLSLQPGVFNHYEPLSYMGLQQVRSGILAEKAISLLQNLLDCSYSEGPYMNYLRKEYSDMLGHNEKVWLICHKGPNPSACFNHTFLQSACQYFPIQVSKLVRLRLNLTQFLMNDPEVKVVYLVRDPRGTMSSRFTSVKWCRESEECFNPKYLCQDIQSDLDFLEYSKQEYPGKIYQLNYENLADEPIEAVKSMFQFLGLTFDKRTEKFIISNTQNDDNKPWSTRRQSKKRIFLWKTRLSATEICTIQSQCRSVIQRLGYQFNNCDNKTDREAS